MFFFKLTFVEKERAKKSALICIDNILEMPNISSEDYKMLYKHEWVGCENYWKEVREYVNAL